MAKVHGQNPGYFGKHFSAGFGVDLSPMHLSRQINKSIFDISDSLNNSLKIKILPEAFFECTIHSKFNIGANVKFYQLINRNYDPIKSEGTPSGSFEIMGFNFSAYGKYFEEPYLAPWGKYYSAGLMLNSAITKYDNYMYIKKVVGGHDTLISEFGPKKDVHLKMDLALGKGRARVIKNHVVLDYGFTLQVISGIGRVMRGFSSILDFEFGNLKANSTNYISKSTNRKVQDVNALQLYLRLAYLF